MGDIPMTFPAFPVHLGLAGKIMIAVAVSPNRSGKHGMTGDTILLHPLRSMVADLNPLGIGVHGEGTGMVPAISHLGQILVNRAANRKMALNTGDITGVGAVLPGRIRGVHDMTVDTGLGVGREIR